MPSTSETGHAKNVANFQDMISFVSGYGPAYNPANALITLLALTAKQTSADASLTAVNTALAGHTTAVNAREIAFDEFQPLLARIANAGIACGLSAEVIEDVRSIIRKLRGARAKAAVNIPDDPSTPEDESRTSHSSSQMSYDMRIENFEKLIELLAAQPLYVPNEADLAILGLNSRLTNLRTVNIAVINAYTVLSNSRIHRDDELYDEVRGLVALAQAVKNYVKSLFGPSSPQWAQLSTLKFSRP